MKAGILAYATPRPLIKPMAAPAEMPSGIEVRQPVMLQKPGEEHHRKPKAGSHGEIDSSGQDNKRLTDRQDADDGHLSQDIQ